MMRKNEFKKIAENYGIDAELTEKMWKDICALYDSKTKFSFTNVLYYFGAMIIIGAMGWFMNSAWEAFGGWGIMLTSLLYQTVFFIAGGKLWRNERLRIPAGLLLTVFVCITPLTVYGLEKITGFWPQDAPGVYSGFHKWIKGGWFIMEASTVAVSLVVIRKYPFEFLTAPIAFCLWYMSMDITPLLFGLNDYTWEQKLYCSVVFGAVMLLVSFIADRRTERDFSFWGYLFGMMSLWGGLSLMESGSELNKLLYCLLNVCFMIVSVWLKRRVFIVFGALGVFGYLGYLSYHVFSDSVIFPFALSALGMLLILSGMFYQKKRKAFEGFILSATPAGMRNSLKRFGMDRKER